MSAARVDSAGLVKTLDGRAEPDEVITEKDVQDPSKLARMLGSTTKTLAALRRRFVPRRIDFEGVVCSTIGATTAAMEHGFKGAVRWWVVDWIGSGAGPSLQQNVNTTTDTTLYLQSYTAGTATIRVEEAG